MPLLRIEHLDGGGLLGIWQMTEAPDCDEALMAEARRLYRIMARQREYVCVRLLLRAMLGRHEVLIDHLESGKPFLVGDPRTLSISHTRGYCAALLTDGRGGVDVEYCSDRVNRIAHRFLRTDEKADDTLSRLAFWSAKETIYKMFSEDHLDFSQMRVCLAADFHEADAQHPVATLLHGENLLRNVSFPIACFVSRKYVLTYSTF